MKRLKLIQLLPGKLLKSVIKLGVALTTVGWTTLNATNYYVDATSGSDTKDGKSAANAWKSLTNVNATTFLPGDSILLKTNSNFTGQLFPLGSGSAGKPIVINSYGTGSKPVINGNGLTGSGVVNLSNQQYWEINNLEIINNAATEGDRLGVKVSFNNGIQNRHIYLKNLYIHDVFGMYTFEMPGKNTGGIGFRITGTSTATAADDILVEGCEIGNVVRVGITTNSSVSNAPKNSYTNLIIRNNTIHHCAGDGVILRFAYKGRVENNLAYENHNASEAQVSYGVALWCRSTDSTLFQFNEVYNTRGKLDGHAFDSDYYTSRTFFQYNYTHNNEGGMVLMMNGSTNTTIRYNISQNDGSLANHVFYFSEYADPSGNTNRGSADIYNNTIYIPAGTGPVVVDRATATTTVSNNIIYNLGTGAAQVASAGQTAVWNNNCYYGNNLLPSDPQLITTNPMLLAPGTGGSGLNSVNGYKLKPGSPALKSGKIITANGGRDYFGLTVAAGTTPNRGADNNPNPVVQESKPVAGLSADKATVCLGEKVIIKSNSTGNITSYSWNFGAGSSPATAAGTGPFEVSYSTSGIKSISVTVSNSAGSDTKTISLTVLGGNCTKDSLQQGPVQDAYVRDGATYTSTTFGTTDSTNLLTKNTGTPDNGFNRETYLSFDISSLPANIAQVKLKMYGKLGNGGTSLYAGIYAVGNTTWNEKTLTYSNKPTVGALLDSAYVTSTTGDYYFWDITNYVKEAIKNSKTQISLRLQNITVLPNAPQTVWNSKESASNPPVMQTMYIQDIPTGIKEERPGQIIIFPNPLQNQLTISMNAYEPAIYAEVYTILGHKIADISLDGLRAEINAETWSEGIYLVKVKTSGHTFIQKIVKQ